MFPRRHPYLFFLLILAGLGTVGMASLAMVVMTVSGVDTQDDGDKVGVIEIVGAIVDSQTVIDDLKAFREDEAVKAIVVRIDSPGGGVGPSQEIYREIRKTVAEKKVIASMGSVAASGGYYVAAASDGIVANPGTITGSIGVIMGYTNFETLMQKIGLTPVVIKSGEYKDLGSPARPMTAKEKSLLEGVTRTIHRQFVGDIAAGRSMAPAQVEAVADGRIFTGEDAQKLGLVDRLGNFQDAVQWAGELGGIEGEVETLYPEKERPSFLEYFMESALRLWDKGGLRSRLVPEAILR
ncbi:MAG: signal peptide peptidase SppA [Desulfatitalea sp.]|nr:signal peptide peptidase SppA [Desulfatitalea sp.]MBI5896673.1 signal peptide peptidase SppA [Desulfobacterales bacterium]